MPFKPGEYVLIHARVVNVYGADREEAYQTYGLQLADGQGMQTNIGNLEAIPELTAREQGGKASRSLTKGDRVTANEQPGVFVAYLADRPYARVDLDVGGRIVVEEDFVKPEKAKKKAEEPKVRAGTQPPPRQHKMVTGPNTASEK